MICCFVVIRSLPRTRGGRHSKRDPAAAGELLGSLRSSTWTPGVQLSRAENREGSQSSHALTSRAHASQRPGVVFNPTAASSLCGAPLVTGDNTRSIRKEHCLASQKRPILRTGNKKVSLRYSVCCSFAVTTCAYVTETAWAF